VETITLAPSVRIPLPGPPLRREHQPVLVRLGAVVSALSHALDLSTGQFPGHSVRSCILGMRIGEEIGLSEQTRSDLFYALLLKDCGYSGNTWAMDSKRFRAERGASLVRLMGLSDRTARTILHADEHWDDPRQAAGLRKTEIPVMSQIVLLAQTLEMCLTTAGEHAATDSIDQLSGRWFDPDLVRATTSLAARGSLWADLRNPQATEVALRLEPRRKMMTQDDGALDSICVAFAQIVDAKSPFTFNHSSGVANAAMAIGRTLDLPWERVLFLRHAALLHDLGKLGVPNAVLEKPGKLDDAEWETMRLHPSHTWRILKAIPGFDEMSEVAASHHEKLNGTGYFRGIPGALLSLEARILAVADVFDALSAKRPYRDGLPPELVLQIMRKDAPHALDETCLEALEQSGAESDQTFIDLQNLNRKLNSY